MDQNIALLKFDRSPFHGYVVGVIWQEEPFVFGDDVVAAITKFSELLEEIDDDNYVIVELARLPLQVTLGITNLLEHKQQQVNVLCHLCSPNFQDDYNEAIVRLITRYRSSLEAIFVCDCGAGKTIWNAIKKCDRLTQIGVFTQHQNAVGNLETATDKEIINAINKNGLKFFHANLSLPSLIKIFQQNAPTLRGLIIHPSGHNSPRWRRPFDVVEADGMRHLACLLPTLPPTIIQRMNAINGMNTNLNYLSLCYSFNEYPNISMDKYRQRIASLGTLFPNLTYLRLFPMNVDQPMDEKAAVMLLKEFINSPTKKEREVYVSLLMPDTELPWIMIENGYCKRIQKSRDEDWATCTRITKGLVTVVFYDNLQTFPFLNAAMDAN